MEPRIIDVFTFNGEYDLLEVRLNTLNSVVDEFIIIEAPTTFSGKPKPLYYEAQKERYSQFASKIKYFVIDESYGEEEIAQAYSSPNTQGADHWKHEFLQKESIKKALTHLNDNDIVFIGDVDEIWFPEAAEAAKMTFSLMPDGIVKLKLRVYCYYFNNRSTEEFWGPINCRYGAIKNKVLNHVRSDVSNRNKIEMGWHFTSLRDILRRKLENSYTEDTYASPQVMNNLESNIAQNKDFLGRPFSYTVDESGLPQYLLDNKEKYKNLWLEK